MEQLHYKDNAQNRDVISLFSGAMGLDLGLTKAGLTTVIGQDFNHACAATMQENGYKALEGDIRGVDAGDLLGYTGLSQGEPFLLCGGPPCQPSSTAGKRLGVNDPRGSLFMDLIRMIDYIHPRFFVMENVRGITSAPLKTDGGDKSGDVPGTVLDIILSEFDKLDYKTVHGVLDAVNYGVPQFRERFILIGSRDNEPIFLPFPTHFQKHQSPACRWRTLQDTIKDLEQNCGDCAAFSKERMNYLRLVPEGGNWRSLPEDIRKETMGGAYESGGGKVGFYRRLSYTQPSPTLVTSPVQKATMMCHPTQDRPLSIREYARIQQFPDDWKFVGTTAEIYRQIGNAVPVGLGQALGEAIVAAAEGSAEIKTRRFRGANARHKAGLAMKSD